MSAAVTDPCADAIDRASKWIDIGRPIIKAMYAMEDAAGDLNSAWVSATKADRYTYDEAARYVNDARERLYEMLDGLRENFICDVRKSGPSGIEPPAESDAYKAWIKAWDDTEDFNDRLDRETLTVAKAERIVVDEMNAEFGL